MRQMLSSFVLAVAFVAFVIGGSSPVVAQVRGPSDVTVAVGDLAEVTLTLDADESKYAVLSGQGIWAFREYDPDPKTLMFRVFGQKPGTAMITVASVKGGKLQPLFVVRVTITGDAPPGPGPGPDPRPDPADPLAARIVAAAQADKWPVTEARKLAQGFRDCAGQCDKAPTAAFLLQLATSAIKLSGVKPIPVAVRAVLSAELEVGLPADAEAEITPELSKRCRDTFTRLAAALETIR
jgi:hypothetical protein